MQETSELTPKTVSNTSKPKTENPTIRIRDLNFSYGNNQVLHDVSLDIHRCEVMAFIGPSGCGKSTLLRCLNRMNDLVDGAQITKGTIEIQGTNLHDPAVDVIELRKKVGMVFQKSNPFPKSIYQNVAYGLQIQGIRSKGKIDERVEESLRKAALWEEVKDRLNENAYGLSGGQQQRLCIARTLAVEPEIILMDEPCSALDPVATGRVEELILGLKDEYTIVVVTHNMQQAGRISDRTAFFYLGKLIECDTTKKIFINPDKKQTEDYISGKFG